MKLSKKFAYYKKAVGETPRLMHVTRNVAIEMYAQRKLTREPDWDLAMANALAMRSYTYDALNGKLIQLHAKTNELLSGTHELLGLILSGLKGYPLWISFPDPDMSLIDVLRSTLSPNKPEYYHLGVNDGKKKKHYKLK